MISADVIRHALLNYDDPQQLSSSPLAEYRTVERCCLRHDDALQRGYAVQTLLRWGLERLRDNPAPRVQRSYQTLYLRYVQKMSLSDYAKSADVAEDSAQARRRTAVQTLMGVIQDEVEQPQAEEKRFTLFIQTYYENLLPEIQTILRLLALFNRPIPLIIDDFLPLRINSYLPDLQQMGWVVLADQTLALVPNTRDPIYPYLVAKERQQWWEILAELFRQQSQIPLSAECLLAANQPETAAKLLIQYDKRLNSADLLLLLNQFRQEQLSLELWAQIKLLAGRIAHENGLLSQSVQEYQAVLVASFPLLKAKAYYQLARLHRHTDLTAALRFYDMAISCLKYDPSAESQRILTQLLIDRSWIYSEQRPTPDLAHRDLDNAWQLLQQMDGVERLYAEWHNAQAHYQLLIGEQDKAADHLWQAWQYAQEAGDVAHSSRITHNLGTHYYRQNKYQLAKNYYETSKQLAQQIGDARMEAFNEKGLGYCAFGCQLWDDAVEHYQQAYRYFCENEDIRLQASLCYDLAEAYLSKGDLLMGKQFQQKGIELATSLGDEGIVTTLKTLSDLFPELRPELNDRQARLLVWLRQNPFVTNQQYRTLNECSKKSAENDLSQLVTIHLLERVGQGRATHYRIPP